MTPEQRAREIVCQWAGTDVSSQPLENLIQAVAAALAEAGQFGLLQGREKCVEIVKENAALREQLDAETKACGHWFKEANQEYNDNERLRRRVAELEADRDVYKDPGWIEQIASRARIEGLRIARKIAFQADCDSADPKWVVDMIDDKIGALERGKGK